MKNRIILILIGLSGHLFSLSAQIDTINNVYSKLDTLYYYRISIRAEIWGSTGNYWVNDRPVSKQTYYRYKNFSDNLFKCKPCYLKTLNANGKLIREAVQYTDCFVGKRIDYYSNGRIKIKGQYKENNTGDWSNLSRRGYCSKKEGTWRFYERNGKRKIEKYKNGRLIE